MGREGTIRPVPSSACPRVWRSSGGPALPLNTRTALLSDIALMQPRTLGLPFGGDIQNRLIGFSFASHDQRSVVPRRSRVAGVSVGQRLANGSGIERFWRCGLAALSERLGSARVQQFRPTAAEEIARAIHFRAAEFSIDGIGVTHDVAGAVDRCRQGGDIDRPLQSPFGLPTPSACLYRPAHQTFLGRPLRRLTV